MRVTGSSIEQLEKGKPRSRCRKWRLWATTEEGRRSRRFEGTWTQAQDALRAFVSELEGIVPNKETFGAYADSWLAWTRDSGRYTSGSIANYVRDVRALKLALGDKSMDSITPEACKAALLSLKHGGAPSGRELTNTYLASFHGTLRQILQTAEDDGRIARNPMAKVPCPKPDTPERGWLSPAELSAFLDRLAERPLDQWSVALYLISYLGLRRGEALALLDSDVDIREEDGRYVGTAHVHQAVKEKCGSVDAPKSRAGVRVLPMPEPLCEIVVRWREVRRALGLGNAPTLCCNSCGKVMHPQNLGRWWRMNRDALGCPGMGLHQLRHSNLSLMARRMSPFDLKDWAGWSSIAPAKVYVHRDVDSMRAAVSDVFGIGSAFRAPKTHQEGKAGQE